MNTRSEQSTTKRVSQRIATVLMVDVLTVADAYVDTHREAPPILVIESGAIELQLSVAGRHVTPADLTTADVLLKAVQQYRAEIAAQLR